uniref:receptor protein-tyrosine kinase n=1 Tax=Astyanax mexicanus TaxID=7994 RepID=A0A8B9J999_ASTMX
YYTILIMHSIYLHISSTNLYVPLGLQFVESPANVTSSLGKPVGLHCILQGDGGDEGPPDILWLREGQVLEFADTNQVQMPFSDDNWMVMSTLRIEEVQLSDMGAYHCAVVIGTEEVVSIKGHIQLEGLPHFSVEPHPMTVVANVGLSLQCIAHGPPEPVEVIWLQDGAPLNTLNDPVALSPSTLNITGLNKTSSFSCEAHNRKGVASSGSGVVTVLPAQPQDVKAVEVTNASISLSWTPGFAGIYSIALCTVQSGEASILNPDHMIHNQNVNVPPARDCRFEPCSCSSCRSISGWSSRRAQLVLLSLVPDSPPVNVTAVLNETEVLISWAEPPGKMNGELQGYIIEYSTPNMEQVMLDVGLDNELPINLSTPLSNISFRMSAYTGAGHGPWTPLQILSLIPSVLINTLYMFFSSVNSLGISDELKQKLQDVMVDRHKLTLGKTLGEGEFGSVMEGLLSQEDSVLKVAVKTMKIAICTRTEMEDFLREAACMKEFDHQNYLPSQMLVKFMTDIARGMEYLSGKNFIHRDLACNLKFSLSRCRYSLMFSCWLLSPKDRPSFEMLRCELEKALDELPDPQDPDEILYVNMEESSGELGAVGGRDPGMGGLCPLGALKGTDTEATVEIHPPNRYVICPQHESQRLLSAESLESLNLSGSTPTLLLQPSSRSTPVPPAEIQPPEERDVSGGKRLPWQ